MAQDALASFLLASASPPPNAPLSDPRQLLETVDGSGLVTVGCLATDLKNYLGIRDASDAPRPRDARGVASWKELEAVTRVSERVLRRLVSGPLAPSIVVSTGGVASSSWISNVRKELRHMLEEDPNNFRLGELVQKLQARGLFLRSTTLAPSALSDLFGRLIFKPGTEDDGDAPVGRLDPSDQTLIATAAGLGQQARLLEQLTSDANTPIAVSALQSSLEERGLVVAKAAFDAQLRGLPGGTVARGFWVPERWVSSLQSSVVADLEAIGYLEYQNMLRAPQASAIYMAHDYAKRLAAGDAKLTMLANALVTSAFVDRMQAEVDESLEEKGWVDLTLVCPFVLDDADEREPVLAKLWSGSDPKLGSRRRLGSFLVDPRLLAQIAEGLKPFATKIGQQKGAAQRGKGGRAKPDTGKMLKQEQVDEAAHGLYPAVPVLLLNDIVEHLLPALEQAAVEASRSLSVVHGNSDGAPAIASPEVVGSFTQLDMYASGAMLLRDEPTRAALLVVLSESPIMQKVAASLKEAGLTEVADNLRRAIAEGDQEALKALRSQLLGDGGMRPDAEGSVLANVEADLKRQLNDAEDPALVLHIAALLLFQRATTKPLLASGRFVPKILSHVSSVDGHVDPDLLKLLQAQQKRIIKSLKDPSAVAPEDIIRASADIKSRLV